MGKALVVGYKYEDVDCWGFCPVANLVLDRRASVEALVERLRRYKSCVSNRRCEGILE